jgi:tetratricopeptide (TPR) repeat protein
VNFTLKRTSLGLRFSLALLTAMLFGALNAHAEPFLPKDDKQVLERLPAKPTDPIQAGLRDLRRALAANPQDLALATTLADHYFRLAVGEGDPRYIGYAQAALAPWWTLAEPPTNVLILRAGLRQYMHDFESAISDLTLALKREPDNLDALSYRAVIYIVMARYDEARHDCREMVKRDGGLIPSSCEPTVDALTGRAAAAYDTLTETLRRSAVASPGQILWVTTRLGEIAQRLGRTREAEAHYRAALAMGITDQYLLTTWAEFLLDLDRPAEVVTLLKDKTRNDVLLLRLALAEKKLGAPATAEHQAAIQSRIDAARLRKDKLHLSDEAIFELVFLKKPQEAVRLAQENWESGQREPSDARILLEAALGARDKAAAKPALEWMTRNRHEDVVLKRLLQQVGALP